MVAGNRFTLSLHLNQVMYEMVAGNNKWHVIIESKKGNIK